MLFPGDTALFLQFDRRPVLYPAQNYGCGVQQVDFSGLEKLKIHHSDASESASERVMKE
jgi:hypothetical protein